MPLAFQFFTQYLPLPPDLNPFGRIAEEKSKLFVFENNN